MNPDHILATYPILLSPATPEALERLLVDNGIPVARAEAGLCGRHRFGIHSRDEIDFTDRFGVSHAIAWQELIPGAMTVEAIDAELARSECWAWQENEVTIDESIVRGTFGDSVVERLRNRIRSHGVPWIRLAPWPAGFEGVFNFRFDLDEPDFEDWRQVVRIVDSAGVEPGVTWFLSTRAASRIPEACSLLAGRDVQSHGHWHHCHASDPGLNAENIARADRFLRSAQFRPTGFAPPSGRITPDLAGHLARYEYRYLSGLGDLSGSLPRTDILGLTHIHAIPVCEGAFLEAGIGDAETVVSGYMAAAARAVSRDRPIFWFGHPDRRLGRKPEILRRLLSAASEFGRLWHVGLGAYADWFRARNRIALTVASDERYPGKLSLQWHSSSRTVPEPVIWIEHEGRRWPVVCGGTSGQASIRLDQRHSTPIPAALPVPECWPALPGNGLRSVIRTALDWERETPVESLRGGPLARRVKGFLRRSTDKAWQARFAPLAWPREDRTGERAA
ncbi:hypothetical protein GC170_12210 [bacterium]|nr:hypothetical protein [bacterium]